MYSFWVSQSTGLLALSTPSPDVLFKTTASNGASCPWILNAQISPGGKKVEEREKERKTIREIMDLVCLPIQRSEIENVSLHAATEHFVIEDVVCFLDGGETSCDAERR